MTKNDKDLLMMDGDAETTGVNDRELEMISDREAARDLATHDAHRLAGSVLLSIAQAPDQALAARAQGLALTTITSDAKPSVDEIDPTNRQVVNVYRTHLQKMVEAFIMHALSGDVLEAFEYGADQDHYKMTELFDHFTRDEFAMDRRTVKWQIENGY